MARTTVIKVPRTINRATNIITDQYTADINTYGDDTNLIQVMTLLLN